jgi:hypothetical protein
VFQVKKKEEKNSNKEAKKGGRRVIELCLCISHKDLINTLEICQIGQIERLPSINHNKQSMRMKMYGCVYRVKARTQTSVKVK